MPLVKVDRDDLVGASDDVAVLAHATAVDGVEVAQWTLSADFETNSVQCK